MMAHFGDHLFQRPYRCDVPKVTGGQVDPHAPGRVAQVEAIGKNVGTGKEDLACNNIGRFNADGPDGLVTRKAPGPQTILNDGHRRALAEIIEAGPIPASHGVVRWRIIDLAQWLWDEFKISISKQALGHELRTMGYRKLSARPRHQAQKLSDIAVFKKSSPPVWRKSAKPSPKVRQ
jgi:transposase